MDDVVRAIKAGNKERFREIVSKYENEIYWHILKMVLQPAVAEELTQDVFVTAYTKLHQYKTGVSFRAWLYKIAKNHSLNYLKRQSKYFEIQKNLCAEDLIPDDKYNVDGFKEVIEKALTKLSEKEKSLLILKAVEELTYKELSVVFNRSESTLRKQFERVRTKFKKYYQVDEEDTDVRTERVL